MPKERIQVQLGDLGDSIVSLSASSAGSSEGHREDGKETEREVEKSSSSGGMGESWASDFKEQAAQAHSNDFVRRFSHVDVFFGWK